MTSKTVYVTKIEIESSSGTVADMTKHFKSAVLTESSVAETVYIPLTLRRNPRLYIKHHWRKLLNRFRKKGG